VSAHELDIAAQLNFLLRGEMSVAMRMPYSSNATYLVSLALDDKTIQAIYKPMRGERPLWDFAPGLHRREVAAYLLSEAMGLGCVPPTILRDGPSGEGSVQLLIEFRAMCAFDILANNTDRKSGHVLVDKNSHVWGIDHGVCFSEDFKLRTVIWEFGGEKIAEDLMAKIEPLTQTVPLEVATLLSEQEVVAITERAKWLFDGAQFPIDPSGRHYPWPLV
jgi:hypothetical protein